MKLQYLTIPLCLFFAVATLGRPALAIQSGSRGAVSGGSVQVVPAPSVSLSSEPSVATPPVTIGFSFSDQTSQPTFTPTPLTSGRDSNATSAGSSGSIGVPAAAIDDEIWTIHDPFSNIVIDHSLWTCFLQKYVVTDSTGLNRLRYRNVSDQDRQLLQQYLSQLKSTDVRQLNRTEQLAFWLNLYNAQVVQVVLDNYPLFSIRQVKSKPLDLVGPFDDEVIQILGKSISLTTVESGIIRPIWGDPRIHYALNCASVGCPNLATRAWESFDLDARLDQAAYEFINSGRAIKTRALGTRLTASKIYKWYKSDFGGTDQAVLNHISQYADSTTRAKINGRQRINRFYYNWFLNDARRQ